MRSQPAHTQFSFSWRSGIEVVFLASAAYLLANQALLLFRSESFAFLFSFFSQVTKVAILCVLSAVALTMTAPRQTTVQKKTSKKHPITLPLLLRGWRPWLVVVGLMLVALAIRAPGIGKDAIRGDEYQVVDAAAGYFHTGDYYRWGWIGQQQLCADKPQDKTNECYYDRAWPHTWLIAQTYRFFGVSETTSRLPSLVFGLVLIALVYPITVFFTNNRRVALVVTGIFVITPFYIELSRYTRMYALLVPSFLLLGYTAFRALTEVHQPQWLQKNQLLKTWLPFHFEFGVATILLLWWNFHLHINSLVLLPVLYLYTIVLSFVTTEKKYRVLASVGTVGLLIVAALVVTGVFKYNEFLSLAAVRNYRYLFAVLGYPLSAGLAGLMLVLGGVRLGFFQSKEQLYRNRLVLSYLLLLIGVPLLFFIFVANRYYSFVYTSHLTTFAILTVVWCVVAFAQVLSKWGKMLLFVLTFVAMALNVLYQGPGRFVDQGTADMRRAYREINQQYQPGDTLFLQYQRRFYLQQLPAAQIVSMGTEQSYSIEAFLRDLLAAKKGWIAWETAKAGHLSPDVRQYIERHFQHLHGTGIDSTEVEVYYFDTQWLLNETSPKF